MGRRVKLICADCKNEYNKRNKTKFPGLCLRCCKKHLRENKKC
jgi:hypothetical protein